MSRFLTALPVYNEVKSVMAVLDEVLKYSSHVLVVDDGSTDGTSELLQARHDVQVIRHEANRGYGAALNSAFKYAIADDYDVLVTIDCDGQHEPQRICPFVKMLEDRQVDIVSGSRYLGTFAKDTQPPADRRRINREITREINASLDLSLTDAFCGFKAYRVSALKKLEITETGYAMPLELWVQAACHRLKIEELAVPLIYLDASRSFGQNLDDPGSRLAYYRQVLEKAIDRLPEDCPQLRFERHS